MARVGGQWISMDLGRGLQGALAHFGGWWPAAWAWGLQVGIRRWWAVLDQGVSGDYISDWGLGGSAAQFGFIWREFLFCKRKVPCYWGSCGLDQGPVGFCSSGQRHGGGPRPDSGGPCFWSVW